MVSKGRQAEHARERRPLRKTKGPVVYVEGGAKGALADRARRAFGRLFEQLPLERRVSVVACGSRHAAHEKFLEHLARKRPEPALLLVDAEEVLTQPRDAWRHVKERVGDGWSRPAGADDRDLAFMAVVMETWCLADGASVLRWLGRKAAFTCPRSVESLPKDEVYRRLEKLTAGAWNQGTKASSFDYLEQLNAAELERQCPEFKLLVARLRELTAG